MSRSSRPLDITRRTRFGHSGKSLGMPGVQVRRGRGTTTKLKAGRACAVIDGSFCHPLAEVKNCVSLALLLDRTRLRRLPCHRQHGFVGDLVEARKTKLCEKVMFLAWQVDQSESDLRRLTCMYIHTYIRTYVHTYIHTYIHTHTRYNRAAAGSLRFMC